MIDTILRTLPHGESLIPLFRGFGFNVPAVFGVRLIQSPRARLLTILVTPLVPCSGRMVVLVFMAGALFGGAAPAVTWGLVALNLVLLAATGIFIDRAVLHSARPALFMELPLDHMPTWRAIALESWQSIKDFMVRAGTIVLLVSLVVWVLANLPSGDIQQSYLAQAGRLLEPQGGLMGLDWRMMVALLTSFVAKENALATMAVLVTAGEDSGLVAALPQILAPASALAYLVLQITFIPWVTTVTAIHRETRSLRWTGFALGYLLVLSLAVGVITFQGARLLENHSAYSPSLAALSSISRPDPSHPAGSLPRLPLAGRPPCPGSSPPGAGPCLPPRPGRISPAHPGWAGSGAPG